MSENGKAQTFTRREILATGAGVAAATLVACETSKVRELGSGDGGVVDTGASDAGASDGGAETMSLGPPEVSSVLWQTMAAYVRVVPASNHGTRVNLYNPTPVNQRVVIQVFRTTGELVVKHEVSAAFLPERSLHLELEEYLTAQGVSLPFEGSFWVGTTPASGVSFMGLQGITFDWYGPAHLASVHGMRDFGNSNEDRTWTDLILPKVVNRPRFGSKIAILNGTGDGLSEALIAEPELILRDDAGGEIVRTTLAPIPPYNTRLIDITEILNGASMEVGSMQIVEPRAALVALGFVVDRENGGIASADHFFDRHFVVHGLGFTG